ncbi:hypothetical protein AWB69_02871 [Caballeronia udeis]|uniref:O-antigen polymerase n=1 Tax=Caballeronia udeis TaxID=1232866 RepID=A0A158GKW7_9BURK|nr:O-antigen ligase family protein [Caballeronia udeis]SAL32768.1 hypothetical protein AWB69_02871 [Caballeronia udeis]
MRHESDDLIIYYIVGAFALDNVVNYFSAIPVFVASIPVSILLMFRFTRDKIDRFWFIACILCLLTSALINFLRFSMTIEDVSDILFLMQFFAAFFYAKNTRISPSAISHATYVFAALFLPAFIGINGSDYGGEADVFTSGSNDIEFLRIYNQGLYRLPHVASYLLAFGSLWWIYVASFSRKKRHFMLAALFLYFTLYTGSRTPIIVIVAAYLVANIRLQARQLLITASIFMLAGLFVVHIREVLDFLFGSFLYQYLSFFETVLDNFDRLSRVIIWDSWLSAIASFNGLDFFIGRNFSSSYDFNMRQIGLYIWFHNDFLSAFYSYGMPVLIAYAIPHLMAVKIAIQRRSSAILLSVLGFFIFATAFVNGFYKYLPVMFFVLLFSDRAAVAAYARGITSAGGSTQGRLQLDEGNRAAEAQ